MSQSDEAEVVEATIARRRVTRIFSEEPVADKEIERLVEAVYWAPSGGGRRPVRVIAVREAEQVSRIVAFSPGVIGRPTAVLVLCCDWGVAPHLRVDDPRDSHSTHVDVGAAMAQVLLLAEAMGLGACPVMSFHRPSIQTILQLPPNWTPLLLIALGHRNEPPSSRKPARLGDILYWEHVGNRHHVGS